MNEIVAGVIGALTVIGALVAAIKFIIGDLPSRVTALEARDVETAKEQAKLEAQHHALAGKMQAHATSTEMLISRVETTVRESEDRIMRALSDLKEDMRDRRSGP